MPESLPTRAAWTAYAVARAPVERRAPFRPPAALERSQRRRVRGAVAHAYEHVPYYRETMDRLGLGPADIQTAAELAKLPVIEREQLQRDPEYFVSKAKPVERYVQLATDGTSGRPIVVYHDPFALFQGATHGERREPIVFGLAGKRLRLRRVFVGDRMGTIARTSRAFHRRSLIPVGIRYTDLRLSAQDPLAQTAERISEFGPDLVRAAGSWVERLFVHLHRSRQRFRAPKVVVYGAAGVAEPIRRMIREEFGVALLSEYGAGEAHHIGIQCGQGDGLHLNSDLYPLRIVDAEGRDLRNGESGEVVISNLVNRATVLLNYRLGDRAGKLPDPCPCGRSLPRLSLPEGRVDDWVESPTGELVYAQSIRQLLLADDRWILTFQVEQVDLTRYAVSVVVREGADREALRERITERFAERLGEQTETEVRFVDALERTPGGKARAVITSRRPRAARPSAP